MRKMNGSILVLLLCAMPALAEQAKEAKEAEAPPASAETQAMMAAWEKASTPGEQHRQLAEHFVGQWTTKQMVWWDPAAPPAEQVGKASTEALFGGRTLRMNFDGEFMGQPFQGVGYTGYDNVTGRYYSSWTDSMATGLMVSYGEYDAASKTYTFHAEMHDPMRPEHKTPIRNVIRIVDADQHVFEMYETHDGKENKSMVIEYRRVE